MSSLSPPNASIALYSHQMLIFSLKGPFFDDLPSQYHYSNMSVTSFVNDLFKVICSSLLNFFLTFHQNQPLIYSLIRHAPCAQRKLLLYGLVRVSGVCSLLDTQEGNLKVTIFKNCDFDSERTIARSILKSHFTCDDPCSWNPNAAFIISELKTKCGNFWKHCEYLCINLRQMKENKIKTLQIQEVTEPIQYSSSLSHTQFLRL